MDENLLIPYTIFHLLLDKIEIDEVLLVPIEYKDYLFDYKESELIDIKEEGKYLQITSSIDRKKDLQNTMLEIISEIPNDRRISYGKISKLIFTLGTIGNIFNESNDNEINLNANHANDSKKIDKINDHINLSIIQLNQILEATKKANQISNQTLKDIASIKEIKGQIYSEFIAIIGIFSALIFGLFGGFEGIKGVLSLFEEDDKFGIISMYCGLVTLMIVTITFALIQFVGRLIGRNLKSCCYKTDCKCKPQDKYNIYTICVYISIGMIILGAIFNGNERLMDIIFWIIMIGILLTLIPTILKTLSFLFKKISSIIK